MENKKTKIMLIVCAMFGIIAVTVAASFAFFAYSRTGKESLIIRTGNLEFAMIDGTSVELTEKFPQSDEKGSNNIPYQFTVKNNSTNTDLFYKVSIVTNNSSFEKAFTNDQIKISLTKNGVYKVGTSKTGVKVSEFITAPATEGEVVSMEAVQAGDTDTFELRMWISSDVNYSGTIDENGLMVGTLNDAEYSLKVKVDAVNEI